MAPPANICRMGGGEKKEACCGTDGEKRKKGVTLQTFLTGQTFWESYGEERDPVKKGGKGEKVQSLPRYKSLREEEMTGTTATSGKDGGKGGKEGGGSAVSGLLSSAWTRGKKRTETRIGQVEEKREESPPGSFLSSGGKSARNPQLSHARLEIVRKRKKTERKKKKQVLMFHINTLILKLPGKESEKTAASGRRPGERGKKRGEKKGGALFFSLSSRKKRNVTAALLRLRQKRDAPVQSPLAGRRRA